MKKGDFDAVFNQGRKFSSQYFVIYARPNGLAFSRLGMAVSRKVGGAVVRNRIKRRLREAVRKQLKENPLRSDIVIVARKAAVDAAFADLEKVISRFFSGLARETNFDSDSKAL